MPTPVMRTVLDWKPAVDRIWRRRREGEGSHGASNQLQQRMNVSSGRNARLRRIRAAFCRM